MKKPVNLTDHDFMTEQKLLIPEQFQPLEAQ